MNLQHFAVGCLKSISDDGYYLPIFTILLLPTCTAYSKI